MMEMFSRAKHTSLLRQIVNYSSESSLRLDYDHKTQLLKTLSSKMSSNVPSFKFYENFGIMTFCLVPFRLQTSYL